MKRFSNYGYLKLLISDFNDLSNGERVLLAVQLLEGCSKTPCTKLGRLFDRCLEGLQLLAEVGKATSMD